MPKLHGSNWVWGQRIRTWSVDPLSFSASLSECHMLARLAQSVWARRQMKIGQEHKYHQRNGDRHGKRAEFDTWWFPLGSRKLYEETHVLRGCCYCLRHHLFNIWHLCSSLQAFAHHTNFSPLIFLLLLFFCSICQPVIPASHLELSRFILISPQLPLPTSVLKGSLQLEGKHTQQ